jgi:ribosome-binding protein aMBF1 (putative translation factor)
MSKHAKTKPVLAVRLGRAIQRARRINELSQAALADKLDLSVNFIARVERGEAFMSVKNLFAVARILKVSLDELVDDSRAAWSAELLALAAVLEDGERTFIVGQLRATVGARVSSPQAVIDK